MEASSPKKDATIDRTTPNGDDEDLTDDAAGEAPTDTDADVLDDVVEGEATTTMDAAREGGTGDGGDAGDSAVRVVDAGAGAGDASDAASDSPHESGSGGCAPLSPNCANAACRPAFACAPSVPAGWSGPSVLFDVTTGPPAPQAPPCPSSGAQYATDAFDGHATPMPPGTTCDCGCGAVTAAACTGPTITIYHGGTCTTQCQNVPDVTSTCARGCAASDALSAAVTSGAVASGGSCAPSGGSVGPFSVANDWRTTGRVCAASRTVSQGGCGASQVCADAPPARTLQAWCVFQAGSPACPPGYPAQHMYFANASDTRACAEGSCACGGPSGVTCNIDSVSVSATTACAAAESFQTTAVGACNQNFAVTARNVTASVTPTGGQCAASGTATPTGTVTPTLPTTVCCTQ